VEGDQATTTEARNDQTDPDNLPPAFEISMGISDEEEEIVVEPEQEAVLEVEQKSNLFE
jgi:hypothetical protein